MSQRLSPTLLDFVQSGVSVQIGTRDSCLVPEAVRAIGARGAPGGERVTVYVPVATGARTLANLADNGRIAICFSRIEDHRTIQVKGRAVAVTPAGEEDRAHIDRYRAAFGANLAFVGLPQRLGYRVASWPCHAIEVAVETVWTQTPGPGAGEALQGAGT